MLYRTILQHKHQSEPPQPCKVGADITLKRDHVIEFTVERADLVYDLRQESSSPALYKLAQLICRTKHITSYTTQVAIKSV